MIVFLLTPEQVLSFKAANATEEKVIVCDHGSGPCIEADFLGMEGFLPQKEWLDREGIEPTEINVNQ